MSVRTESQNDVCAVLVSHLRCHSLLIWHLCFPCKPTAGSPQGKTVFASRDRFLPCLGLSGERLSSASLLVFHPLFLPLWHQRDRAHTSQRDSANRLAPPTEDRVPERAGGLLPLHGSQCKGTETADGGRPGQASELRQQCFMVGEPRVFYNTSFHREAFHFTATESAPSPGREVG